MGTARFSRIWLNMAGVVFLMKILKKDHGFDSGDRPVWFRRAPGLIPGIPWFDSGDSPV